MKSIDLDENGSDIDLEIEYTLGGKKFRCFPVDESDAIDRAIEKAGDAARSGDPFLAILQDRLTKKHGVHASDAKAWKWYQSITASLKEQENFTEGLDASSGSTVSSPDSENSPGMNVSY